MANRVKWKRSEEGYTESHCGRFDIVPLYMGTCSAKAYDLIDSGNDGQGYFKTMHDTQRGAKEYAQEIIDAESKWVDA